MMVGSRKERRWSGRAEPAAEAVDHEETDVEKLVAYLITPTQLCSAAPTQPAPHLNGGIHPRVVVVLLLLPLLQRLRQALCSRFEIADTVIWDPTAPAKECQAAPAGGSGAPPRHLPTGCRPKQGWCTHRCQCPTVHRATRRRHQCCSLWRCSSRPGKCGEQSCRRRRRRTPAPPLPSPWRRWRHGRQLDRPGA